ncbi:MAG: AAA family ATPase [bacterium]|nr:AAA family ATPase [bacterium]
MRITAPPKGTYHPKEEWPKLLEEGIYPIDNGAICDPYHGADHHDMLQEWLKGKPTFYRQLSASQLLLLPEFREGILRRHRERPITTIEIHSPFDLDCVIAQYIFKKIIYDRLGFNEVVLPAYHRLAHYANCYDRFILPYLPNPEYSLKGIMEGLACVWREEPDRFIYGMDRVLEYVIMLGIDPSLCSFLATVKDTLGGKVLAPDHSVMDILRSGVSMKNILRNRLLYSPDWKNRQEEIITLTTKSGAKGFTLVSLETNDPEGVYEQIYGQNKDPRIVFLWNKDRNTPSLSVRPDITKQGVSLFSLIISLDWLEGIKAEELNVPPCRWFDGVAYEGTVTYPLGGKSNLTRYEIKEAILGWAKVQKEKDERKPVRVFKTDKPMGHKSVLAGLMGLPASGKSFVVDVLRDACDLLGKHLVVVSSDAVRKEKERNPADDSHKGVGFNQDIYTSEQNQRNYEKVFDRAKFALYEADAVIIDATLMTKELREWMLGDCWIPGVLTGFVEILAPTEVLLGRSATRWFKPSVSDATPDILEKQLSKYERLTENECADSRVDFALSLFNSDSPEQMVRNTTDLVLRLLDIWFPEEVDAKKEDLKTRVEGFIKRRLARLESKKIQPHAEPLVKEDLLNYIKKSDDKDEALISFSKTWLDFFARRALKVIPIECRGEMVNEARLLTQIAHIAVLGAFDIVLEDLKLNDCRQNFMVLGLEVKSLYSNLDFSIQVLDVGHQERASIIYILTRHLLRKAGWKVTPGSHLQKIIHNKTLADLKSLFVGCGCSSYLTSRVVERGKALLLVSKVLHASPEAEKLFRNQISIPLLSDCVLRKAIVRIEAPKLKAWAGFLPEHFNMPDVKDVVTRGLYGLIELLRMQAQELNIEVEYALQNPLVAPKEEAAILLEAYDFCLRLRVAVQTFLNQEEGLVVYDWRVLDSVAKLLHFSDRNALLEEFSLLGKRVYKVAEKLLPKYYN